MRIVHAVALVMTLVAHQATSQFNDTTNYFIHFGSAGIINKTNETDSYVLNNSFRFSIYKKSISLNTSNSWIYGENQDAITNNDFSSALDFNLYKTLDHFYYWGLGTYERSVSLKINHRYQAGVGVGYNVIDREKALLVISDGILYESSDLYDTPEPEISTAYATLRNSFRIKFRWIIRDVITLEGSDYLQHSLSDRHDYIVRSQTNLHVKLVKWLSFTTSLTYNKLSTTKRENLLINFGLTVEKYF
jgi:hypothetical protein